MPDGLGLRDVRLVVVGDAFAAGVGDPKGLGWLGRVVARSQSPDLFLTPYNLGVRDDSSADVLDRWREESARRFSPGSEHRLVLQMGHGDVAQGLSTARSRLNLANILDDASAFTIPTLVVGPAPMLDASFDERLRVVADAQADVCSRRGVPFVDCFEPLRTHEQWQADLASGDGMHPGQAGYGLIAWLVLHQGWPDWLGITL
ncbi:MAG: GDSL-type esterase/lipase family protein [Actinomycetales bacterium]